MLYVCSGYYILTSLKKICTRNLSWLSKSSGYLALYLPRVSKWTLQPHDSTTELLLIEFHYSEGFESSYPRQLLELP